MKKTTSGFTIVELLIVIVVIAILAAITVVAYNGIQSRANDSRMMSAMNQFEKAIRVWYANSSEYPRGGWNSTVAVTNGNCVDGVGGWAANGTYVCALENILLSQNLIPTGFIRSLPKNKGYGSPTDGALSVMFYPCNDPGEYALYWYLENPTVTDTGSVTAVESAGCPASPRTTYAMKSAKLLQL